MNSQGAQRSVLAPREVNGFGERGGDGIRGEGHSEEVSARCELGLRQPDVAPLRFGAVRPTFQQRVVDLEHSATLPLRENRLRNDLPQ